MKPYLEFTFNEIPVPASRPRLGRYGAYTDTRYRDYKNDLVLALRDAFGYYAWDIPEAGTKERTKYLKQNRFSLNLKIYTEKDTGDYDNYAKSVGDALEQAGIIANDKQIDEAHIYKSIDKANPRIEITLNQLKGNKQDERTAHKNKRKG